MLYQQQSNYESSQGIRVYAVPNSQNTYSPKKKSKSPTKRISSGSKKPKMSLSQYQSPFKLSTKSNRKIQDSELQKTQNPTVSIQITNSGFKQPLQNNLMVENNCFVSVQESSATKNQFCTSMFQTPPRGGLQTQKSPLKILNYIDKENSNNMSGSPISGLGAHLRSCGTLSPLSKASLRPYSNQNESSNKNSPENRLIPVKVHVDETSKQSSPHEMSASSGHGFQIHKVETSTVFEEAELEDQSSVNTTNRPDFSQQQPSTQLQQYYYQTSSDLALKSCSIKNCNPLEEPSMYISQTISNVLNASLTSQNQFIHAKSGTSSSRSVLNTQSNINAFVELTRRVEDLPETRQRRKRSDRKSQTKISTQKVDEIIKQVNKQKQCQSAQETTINVVKQQQQQQQITVQLLDSPEDKNTQRRTVYNKQQHQMNRSRSNSRSDSLLQVSHKKSFRQKNHPSPKKQSAKKNGNLFDLQTKAAVKIQKFVRQIRFMDGLYKFRQFKDNLQGIVHAWRLRKALTCLGKEVQEFVNCEIQQNKYHLKQRFHLLFDKVNEGKLYLSCNQQKLRKMMLAQQQQTRKKQPIARSAERVYNRQQKRQQPQSTASVDSQKRIAYQQNDKTPERRYERDTSQEKAYHANRSLSKSAQRRALELSSQDKQFRQKISKIRHRVDCWNKFENFDNYTSKFADEHLDSRNSSQNRSLDAFSPQNRKQFGNSAIVTMSIQKSGCNDNSQKYTEQFLVGQGSQNPQLQVYRQPRGENESSLTKHSQTQLNKTPNCLQRRQSADNASKSKINITTKKQREAMMSTTIPAPEVLSTKASQPLQQSHQQSLASKYGSVTSQQSTKANYQTVLSSLGEIMEKLQQEATQESLKKFSRVPGQKSADDIKQRRLQAKAVERLEVDFRRLITDLDSQFRKLKVQTLPKN